MYCTECGTENEDTAEVCKKCNAILVPGSHQGPVGRFSLTSYSDHDVGLLIIFIGVVLVIAAVLPFFLLETKDLITMERMRLIITLPLAFIAILLIGTGWVVYQGYHRRGKVLHKVEEDYRGLVENAEDGIFTIDQEGRFTYMNKKGRALLGYAKDELVGRKAEGKYSVYSVAKIYFIYNKKPQDFTRLTQKKQVNTGIYFIYLFLFDLIIPIPLPFNEFTNPLFLDLLEIL